MKPTLYLVGEQPEPREPEPVEASSSPPAAQPEPATPTVSPEHEAAERAELEDRIFRTQLQEDLAHERVLLYRVAVVILVLAGLVLARQWALVLL